MILHSQLEYICKQFFVESKLKSFEELKGGLINKTYVLHVEHAQFKYYILQKINTNIFKKPTVLMQNLFITTEHIQKKSKENPKKAYKSFQYYKTINNQLYYTNPITKEIWRLMDFINAKPVNQITESVATELGKILGIFHHMFTHFDVSKIKKTIPNFHDIPFIYKKFENCLASKPPRLSQSKEVADTIEKYRYLIANYTQYINSKQLKLRLIHNDPKIDNVLFDSNEKALCLIDLDTCMPGYITTDFGDAIRSLTNTVSENEENITQVGFNFRLYSKFTKAYLTETKSFISKEEKNSLAFFALLITYEQGIRFYQDYLQNDSYYRIDYPSHNLQRAKVQLKLLDAMTKKYELMQKLSAY